MNCLNQAISEERIHQVRLLLTLGVDSETRDKNDFYRTPLLKASMLTSEESAQKITKILLKTKLNINAIDDQCRSALHYACRSGKSTLVETLIKEGSVELNKQDVDGRTPLMLSAMNGHLRTSRILALKLAKFDLEMDLRDNKGFTALLHAIKNKNYDIAYDLIRYGNSCTTIRDDIEFKNASEWLRKSLCDSHFRINTTVKPNINDPNNRLKAGNEQQRKQGVSANFPQVTMAENSLDGTAERQSETQESEVPSTIKEVAGLSGLLFEPDPYGRHSRPPSSVVSKISQASAVKRRLASPLHSESMPQLQESQLDDISDLTSEVTGNPRFYEDATNGRRSKADSVIQLNKERSSARKAVASVPSKVHSVSVMRREALANASVNLPISLDGQAHKKSNLLLLVKVPAKDQSKLNINSIQKLKQAIRDQRKCKVTRPSTRITRPYTAIPYEAIPEMEEIKLPTRPHTRANVEGGRRLQGDKREEKSDKTKVVQKSPRMRKKAQSLESLNTLVTGTDNSDLTGVNNYQKASAIERAQRNLRTLFHMYTESRLWTPVKHKPASLYVQVPPVPSERPTLTSEFTASVSDLASIVERGSISQSETASLRQDKVTGRGRLTSGSAISRTSRKSARSNSSSIFR